MKKIILSFTLFLLSVILLSCSKSTRIEDKKELRKIDFILDWTPNTNHTGLYIAKEKGYFKEIGIDLDIKLPPEDSSSDLVINNKAPFAIYFQDSMATKVAKGADIVAVAAIVENNTSGIISKKSSKILEPKDLVNKKYGTWNDPIELEMIKNITTKQGADFSKIQLVPNTDSNSVSSIENNQFDAAWIYYGWDGILANSVGLDTNFFYLKDFSEELNYYSPVIISNNEYLKNNKEEAKNILKAIKKGYQYAIDNPKEAADILIKYVPELNEKRDFVEKSQVYLSKQYATNKEKWGEINPERWNRFYKWINDNNISEIKLKENAGFTNDYIK